MKWLMKSELDVYPGVNSWKMARPIGMVLGITKLEFHEGSNESRGPYLVLPLKL